MPTRSKPAVYPASLCNGDARGGVDGLLKLTGRTGSPDAFFSSKNTMVKGAEAELSRDVSPNFRSHGAVNWKHAKLCWKRMGGHRCYYCKQLNEV